MYAAKSFEQPPRRPSSPVPNRNPLQPLLEPTYRRGTIYRAPDAILSYLPRHTALTYRTPYRFRITFVPNPFSSISLHLQTLRVFTKKHPGWHTYSLFSLLRNSRSAAIQKREVGAPPEPAPPLSGILPAPTLRASGAILPRERGFLCHRLRLGPLCRLPTGKTPTPPCICGRKS